MSDRVIRIGSRRIGPGQPCVVIAEVGVNHNGDMDLACRLVDVAAEAGADFVKFQTFRADRLASPETPQAAYAEASLGTGVSHYDMLKALELSDADHRVIMSRCEAQGIAFLSSAFDEESADYLEGLGVPAFKIPSGELTNLGYLGHVARKGRPMIVSTGMANIAEVEAAVHTIEKEQNRDYILLHCVSNYPADPADVNLRAMSTLETAFGNPVGFSDHTVGLEIALAAVALGACIIEKHFTLDRTLPGPDHNASVEPGELADLVRGVRKVEAAFGSGLKQPAASEANTSSVARKSLVTTRDLAAGTVLTEAMLTLKRPGTGIPQSQLRPHVLGRTLRVDVPADTLLSMDQLR